MNAEWLQFALLIPIGILIGWVKLLQVRLDKMINSTYDKEETDKVIKLHLAPLETKLDGLKEVTNEIKSMLTEVLRNGKSE